MSISTALADKAQSMIPIDLQIRGAHVYDKARRIVTRTDGKKIFTETPSRLSRKSNSPTSI
ncbi:Uncharacterised protein [Tsukamurella pulmonis]|nr:Uncharacterised protein [Tsukamurella pulmonis]